MLKSLRSKMMARNLLLGLITGLVGVWAIINFFSLSGSFAAVLHENYRSVLAAEKMITALERQDSGQLLLLQGEEAMGNRLLRESRMEFTLWYSREEDNITIPGEGEIAERIKKKYMEYVALVDQLNDLLVTESVVSAKDFYLREIYPRFNRLHLDINELLDLNHTKILNDNEKAGKRANWAAYSTLVIMIIALVLSLSLGVNASDIVLKPILQLKESIRRIGEGKLEEGIPVTGSDEIGELAKEFNAMVHRLQAHEKNNVSKFEEAQKKTRAIVNTISDGIIVTNRDSQVLLVNPSAEKMFNILEEDVVGRHFLEVFRHELIFEQIQKALANDIESLRRLTRETLAFTVEDQKRYYHLDVRPVVGQEGQVSGVVTALNDITHYKEVDQMKSDFVSTVSHEFRTPLTSIAMGIGLLREKESTDPSEVQLLEAIDEDTHRLIRLVNQLLDLSKMEYGKIQFNIQPMDVNALVEDIIRPMQSLADEREIVLCVVKNAIPLALCDGEKVGWVISNLVGNALRYTKPGGTITVSSETEGNRILISVADTGIGIPKKYQESIFHKFVQVKPTDNAVSTGGAGLGLALSKEIITAQGGRIWVESEVGKGSTFTFTLPSGS